MRRGTWIGAAGLAAGWLAAPGLGAENAALDAAKALAAKPNYSWTATPQDPGGSEGGRRGRSGPVEGRTEKDGYTVLSMKSGETTVEAILKGDKAVVKSGDAWKTPDELGGGGAPQPGGNRQRDPAQSMARRLRGFRAPAAEAEDLAGKAANLKEEGGAVVGELPEEAVKALLPFGRGGRGGDAAGGGNAPSVAGARGSVTFWIQDGILAKYELTLQGSIRFGDRKFDLNRTTVTEIKAIGTTQIAVPEAAKQKLP